MLINSRNPVTKIIIVCKECKKKCDHYTRFPKLKRKIYCDDCVIKRRGKRYVPKS